LFAYGPVDATAIPKLRHLLHHLNPDWLCLSGSGSGLNGCSSNSSSRYVLITSSYA